MHQLKGQRGPASAITDEMLPTIQKLHAEGHCASYIATVIGVEPKALYHVAKRLNLTLTRKGRRSGISSEQIQQMVRDYQGGVGCLLSSPSSKLVGASYYHCGVLKPSGSGLSQYQLSTLADFNHMTFEGVGLLVKGAQATFTNLNIDNASGTGLEVGSGGRFIATNTGLSGQGNNGFGVSVEKISGYLEIWSSGTSITGTSGAWAFSFVLAMAWTDAPRCYGRGRTSAQALSSGIASFTIPDLPPTANFSPAYAVPKSGVTGVLYPANAATSTVEVRSSDLTDSTSTVTIGWESGQNGMVAKHAT